MTGGAVRPDSTRAYGWSPVSTDLVRMPLSRPVAETMVDRRTGRTWSVDVAPFEMARTAVTVGQWNAVLGSVSGPRDLLLPKVEVSWRDAVLFCNELSRQHGLTPAYAVEVDDLPRHDRSTWTPHDEPSPDEWRVTWHRAAGGYRLPTEAEWQLACRAGSTGPRYGELDDIGWFEDNAGGSSQPVARKAPNAWGLHDTLGGVWEWCWDQYDADVYGPYRVIRGGGWSDPHWSCRAGVRRKTHPAATFDDLGLRLARTIAGSS